MLSTCTRSQYDVCNCNTSKTVFSYHQPTPSPSPTLNVTRTTIGTHRADVCLPFRRLAIIDAWLKKLNVITDGFRRQASPSTCIGTDMLVVIRAVLHWHNGVPVPPVCSRVCNGNNVKCYANGEIREGSFLFIGIKGKRDMVWVCKRLIPMHRLCSKRDRSCRRILCAASRSRRISRRRRLGQIVETVV